MSGEIEAAGELATGALLGRAVEPGAGEGHGGGHGLCLNCGTALVGSHCHNCGQSGHVHRSLHAIGHDILHGVFHFEGKLWNTLPMLAWRPGELTKRYIAGERARFVSPMAIFLFSIFAMFAVFSFAGIVPPTDMRGVSAYPLAAIELERKQLIEARQEAIEKRDRAEIGSERRARQEKRIAAADTELEGLAAAAARLDKDPEVNVSRTGLEALDHGIEKWKKNPSLMVYKLQSSVYKFSWLLIPLSLPFLWLLFFWKRQYKLYDHAVFIIYSIAFMSLLFIVITLAAQLGVPSGWLGMAGVFIPFFHITRQLKQAYQLRWWSAVLRAIVLTWFIAIVLVLFLLILVAMGMTG